MRENTKCSRSTVGCWWQKPVTSGPLAAGWRESCSGGSTTRSDRVRSGPGRTVKRSALLALGRDGFHRRLHFIRVAEIVASNRFQTVVEFINQRHAGGYVQVDNL